MNKLVSKCPLTLGNSWTSHSNTPPPQGMQLAPGHSASRAGLGGGGGKVKMALRCSLNPKAHEARCFSKGFLKSKSLYAQRKWGLPVVLFKALVTARFRTSTPFCRNGFIFGHQQQDVIKWPPSFEGLWFLCPLERLHLSASLPRGLPHGLVDTEVQDGS